MINASRRVSNGLTTIVAAKAVSSPLCILIGLIFGSFYLVVWGAGLAIVGLIGLITMIAVRGFASTIQSFRTLFQEMSRDIKVFFKENH